MKDYERMKRKASDVRKKEIANMAREKPREDAKRAFERPAYQVNSLIRAQGEQMERMTVAEATEYLLQEIQAQRLKPSDPVPEELVLRIQRPSMSAAEYYAAKYKIGGDAGGQERPD